MLAHHIHLWWRNCCVLLGLLINYLDSVINFNYWRSKLIRFTLLGPAAHACWCGQPLVTMATSGHTPTSSCPTQLRSDWPFRRRWAETCGQTSPWMTSLTQPSVWLEVKVYFSLFLFTSIVLLSDSLLPALSSFVILFPFSFLCFLSLCLCAASSAPSKFPHKQAEASGRGLKVNGACCPLDSYKFTVETGSVLKKGSKEWKLLHFYCVVSSHSPLNPFFNFLETWKLFISKISVLFQMIIWIRCDELCMDTSY